MKLKVKLSLLVIAIVIAAITGISVLLLRRASDISLKLTLNGLNYLANDQADYWKGREEGYLRVLHTLSNVMEDYENLPAETRRERFSDMLLGIVTTEPNMIDVYTVWKPNIIDGMDGQFIGQTGAGPLGQYAMLYTKETGRVESRTSDDIDAAMAYFSGPSSKRERVEHPFSRNVNGKDTYLIRMMVPIINPRSNEVVGGVGCVLTIAGAQGVLEQTVKDFEEISAMAIYSGNGLVIAHYRPERIGKLLPDVDTGYGNDTQAAYQAVLDGKPFSTKQYVPALNTNAELILVPFQIGNSDMNWSVMLGTQESYFLSDVQDITRFTIMLSLIVILVTAVILFFALNSVTKPIVRIAETLKDISEGEGDLTRTIPETGKDEISDMSRYFNHTLDKIKKLIINIKHESIALSDIGSDLASNMTETAAAINEITANVQSIKGRVINQSASVTETHATMEQITVNIEKLNGQVENQSENISQASSAIEEMVANIQSVTQTLVNNASNVKELMEASEVGRTGLSDVATDIQEIARESEGLLEINAVMENIASQTNLLSMNAAIEAAHAGEAGKGFAVVADEIRKLAESSSEQSKTISDVLKKIKGSIDKITSSTENVLSKFEAIDSSIRTVAQQEELVRNAMGEQGEGSKQILEGVTNVNEITRQVKNGSEEMLEGSKEVIQESNNLEHVTQEITHGMNEMAAGAEQINVAVNKVNDISAKNKESIDNLVKEVSLFKVE